MATRKPTKTDISKVMSELARESHRKSPRTKAFYRKMIRKRWDGKKLSTGRKGAA